ncbi:MAG: lipopolysaccharide assembly protein LapB [Hydrogenophilales bacterium]|nr:lipopolysaccharide assembly protein LapB [Hydrogenophilales bacterium]
MEFEYWWLLAFPLFFMLGWLAARIDIKHIVSQSKQLPESYFKGLNFLLNQQPDKAIEAFTEAAKADTETVELHFTLGGLFRRRGEVDRAIHLHQALVDRPDLGHEQRLAAQFELGQDFLAAGLLDRAELLFKVLAETHYAERALRFLMEIFVQEREWRQAIATAEQLAKRTNQPHQIEIAHFMCEMAANEAVAGRYQAAHQYLDQALSLNRRSVRASLLLGEFEAAQGRHEEALAIWRRIESQQPDFLPLVAAKMLASFKALGRTAEGLALLKHYLEKYASIDMLNVVYQASLENEGIATAFPLVRTELQRHPTLQGYEKLLEAQLFDVPAEQRPHVQLVKNLIHQHSQRLAYYQCANCGFKARQFFWHCPACTGWETFPPRRIEETAA